MSKTYIPEGYHSELTLYETQNAIGVIHHAFEEHLGQTLNLKRVSAPLFVDPHTGLNDNLSGVERPVSFEIPQQAQPQRLFILWQSGNAWRCIVMISAPARVCIPI